MSRRSGYRQAQRPALTRYDRQRTPSTAIPSRPARCPSPTRPRPRAHQARGAIGSGAAAQPGAGGARRRSAGCRGCCLRDPLTTFLALASLGLAIAFALLLGSIGPAASAGRSRSAASKRWRRTRKSPLAVLLDHDNRVELTTRAVLPKARLLLRPRRTGSPPAASTTPGQPSRRGRPAASGPPNRCGPLTPAPARRPRRSSSLAKSGAIVTVDQQSGKGPRTIVVQFLIPILLLVCLFALFTRLGADGGAGGIAGFSRFTGKGKRKGKGTADAISFADVAGAGEAVAELREIRDYLAEPRQIPATWAPRRPRACCWWGLPAPARRCWPRPSRARPTPPSSRSRARTSWSRSWASARRACATCSPRRARRPPRSSSSTSSTPRGASAAPASARATTSASRRSTRCWSRWTASPATAAWS